LDDTSRYRDLFFEETDEYLQVLNDSLLELERNPEDNLILDEIFRAAHTLKGMAGTMGYNTMAELTHHMENVFELFRQGSVKVTSELITVIFKCVDKLAEIVEDLRMENYFEYNIEDLIMELEQIALEDKKGKELAKEDGSKEDLTLENFLNNLGETDLNVIEGAYERGYKAYSILVKVEDYCSLKGARAYLVVNKLEQQGDVIKTNPNPEELEEGNYDKIFMLVYLSKLDKAAIKDMIEGIAEIESVLVKEMEDTTSKVDEKAATKEKPASNKRRDRKVHQMNQSIRVDLGRLDRFMNLVSELVIYRTRLEDLSNNYDIPEIHEPLEYVGRITSELQDLVLKIRMQPVNVVLNRFPRMVRDLSQELNKEIEFVIEGEDTELDRTIVSELGEPLVHLIRNAADHGIESVEERRALGKPDQGLIKLNAYQEGNRVVIIVSDDGKGIDPDKIKQSAEEKGIDTEGMSQREIIQLIFDQGFSTVKDVTNVSGRGVGMDVVRQKISSLGGNIEVISEVDKGTSFIIRLPLTLSIIQTLMVYIGEEVFAIPLGIIERVVKIRPEEIVESHNSEIYIYMDRAVPVVRLNEKLNLESSSSDNHLILIQLGNQYYGLLVDELIGQQETVIKKLSGPLSKMKEYLGATILGNGEIVLILDVGNLCDRTEGDLIE